MIQFAIFVSPNFALLAPVVQKVDNVIHQINLYPLDNAISVPSPIHWIVIYLLESAV